MGFLTSPEWWTSFAVGCWAAGVVTVIYGVVIWPKPAWIEVCYVGLIITFTAFITTYALFLTR